MKKAKIKVMQKFIVAEASKTWTKDTPNTDLLSNKFEQIINVNHQRGYKLIDWKFTASFSKNQMTETIIAIFELDEPKEVVRCDAKRY